MSKMLVELANLYRQLIYIWDKGVESRGVRRSGAEPRGSYTPESTEAICAISFHSSAAPAPVGKNGRGRYVIKSARGGGRTTGSGGGGVDLSLVPTHMCSKYRNSMDNNNERAERLFPLLPLPLSLSLFLPLACCDFVPFNLLQSN